ncbi:conserved hypothetical protein [Trichinella spiralis]|uniref:hypothetical protein n=1 Tax=Trichinella spiralis TaxID=6334 RepID=UPI0001EFB365|nr:conserved hypothetical protein [Trichinella spiralis]
MLCLIVFTASLHSLLLQLAAAAECSSNSDCGSQTLCYKNKCVPAMPVGGDCESDYDCNISENHYCVYGVCMTYAYVTEDKPNYNQKCDNHYDCSGQRVCKNYKCVAAYATQRTCSYPAECELEEKCMDRLCFKAYVPGDNVNTSSSIIFVNVVCILLACNKHSECSGQAMCVSSKCVAAKPTGPNCDKDSECKDSEACIYGICMSPAEKPPSSSKGCTNHYDCESQQVCHKQKCVSAYSTGISCKNNGGCIAQQVCRFGVCWAAYL